jgi:hypothetical protein
MSRTGTSSTFGGGNGLEAFKEAGYTLARRETKPMQNPGFQKHEIDAKAIPISTPHPHFPCLAIMSSSLGDIMKCVVQGIQDTADEVLWRSSADEEKYEVSATVFLGSQRVGVSVHLFASECKGGEKETYNVLLQALCDSGYGWDFYTIWDGIVAELRVNSKKVQRFVPESDEEPSKPSDQPSLSDQLRATQIPAQYSTASNPPLEELPELTEEDLAPPPRSAPELGIDTMTNLLGSPYDNERCVGLDLVESSIDCKEIREAVQEPLFECVGADSSYADSRIRALSLVRKMVKDECIPDEALPFSYLRKGLDNLKEESKDNKNQTPAFKRMMSEYAELALKVIANKPADQELVDSLEKAKEQ